MISRIIHRYNEGINSWITILEVSSAATQTEFWEQSSDMRLIKYYFYISKENMWEAYLGNMMLDVGC